MRKNEARDYEIARKFRTGLPRAVLAQQYNLSLSRISEVMRAVRRREVFRALHKARPDEIGPRLRAVEKEYGIRLTDKEFLKELY